MDAHGSCEQRRVCWQSALKPSTRHDVFEFPCAGAIVSKNVDYQAWQGAPVWQRALYENCLIKP